MTESRDTEIPEPAEFQLEFADLPHLLRAWRTEAGLKLGRGKALPQKEVAQRMGVSERWYRALESGAQVPLTLDTLTLLAQALDLGPDERTALYWYRITEVSDERQPSDDGGGRFGQLRNWSTRRQRFPPTSSTTRGMSSPTTRSWPGGSPGSVSRKPI